MNTCNYFPLALHERKDIINIPDFNLKYPNETGLCNQLFGLINGIIRCEMFNRKYVIIDSFNCCLNTGVICPVSKIIDLKATSTNINAEFKNIKLFDRSKMNMNIISAEYGLKNVNTINVKQYIDKLICSDSLNLINMNFSFENDPCPNIVKKLYLHYTLDDYDIYDEIIENSSLIDYNMNYLKTNFFTNIHSGFLWYDVINEQLFNKISKCIVFTKGFYDIIEEIKYQYDFNNLNIIHFKIERSSILHYANIYKINENEMRNKIYDKYEYILNKYFRKDDKIYMLTCNENDVFERFGNQYEFYCMDQEKKDKLLYKHHGFIGREMGAIIDFLIGCMCKTTYVGCHNMKRKRGSSFDYMIINNLTCKKILIDLDDLNNDEEFFS
jgi:hypothetical protein